jgi:organic radical activating enzyme
MKNNFDESKLQFEVKKKLDAIGPGMCVSKWKEASILLESGHNHSCPHPNTHKTPLEELINNPSALHNTIYKKSVRKQMLEGIRPNECHYCHKMEDALNKEGDYSDRVNFSMWEFRNDPDIIEKIAEAGYEDDAVPSRLEVSFSNTCNFKCSYCCAATSSSWMKEIEKHGPFPVFTNTGNTIESTMHEDKMPIPPDQFNPYIDAFWKWWPDIYNKLKQFRVTGGEPLLSPHTFKVIDYINEFPNIDLELGINSNLGVPTKIIDRFIDKVNEITSNNKIKSFYVWTSCESYGKQAEYIRDGLVYEDWINNVRRILNEIQNSNVRVMTTYCAMSVISYKRFLEDVYALKAEFPNRVLLDTHTYLESPIYLAVDILTKDFIPYFEEQVEFIAEKLQINLATTHELFRARRQLQYFKYKLDNPRKDIAVLRKDFAIFVDEHDKRRDTNFLETFPEMKDFYNFCKTIK